MSRHVIPGVDASLEVIVGWDGPLETFYVLVMDPSIDEDEDEPCLYWRGTHPYALTTLDALREALDPWGVLPAEVAAQLLVEQATAEPPTPLQRWGRALFAAKS